MKALTIAGWTIATIGSLWLASAFFLPVLSLPMAANVFAMGLLLLGRDFWATPTSWEQSFGTGLVLSGLVWGIASIVGLLSPFIAVSPPVFAVLGAVSVAAWTLSTDAKLPYVQAKLATYLRLCNALLTITALLFFSEALLTCLVMTLPMAPAWMMSARFYGSILKAVFFAGTAATFVGYHVARRQARGESLSRSPIISPHDPGVEMDTQTPQGTPSKSSDSSPAHLAQAAGGKAP